MRSGLKRVPRILAGAVLGLLVAAVPTATSHAAGAASVTPSGADTFTIYTPPDGTAGQHSADEPSIGADWGTGAIMYEADTTTLKVTFDDTKSPANATWTDVSAPLAATSLDPILFTDHLTGRTFESQLVLGCSLSEFTDNDGASWTPDQGCGPNGIEDHQSVGGGPYHAPVPSVPPGTVYPDSVYYCNQDFVQSVTAYCALSVDGGVTFGAGVPIYNLTQCGGLHGHIRVAPDGTAIVPNQNCAPAMTQQTGGTFPNQAAVVTTDNGATWSVNTIPGSTSTLRSDPSVAADAGGQWYFGYENGVDSSSGEQVGGQAMISTSTDDGTTWTPGTDVGAPLGVQNVTFPEVITGDAGRAAYAFLGSTTAGNPENTGFPGTWDLYMSLTYDGGKTWTTSDLTPGDPVERGCIYLAGNGTCPDPPKRNLLDFMDITVDNHGRVLVGYADGCTGTCVTDLSQPCSDPACGTGPTASTDTLVSIARQTCGEGLLAAFDTSLACAPSVGVAEVPWLPGMLLAGGAAAALAVRRRRRPDTTL